MSSTQQLIRHLVANILCFSAGFHFFLCNEKQKQHKKSSKCPKAKRKNGSSIDCIDSHTCCTRVRLCTKNIFFTFSTFFLQSIKGTHSHTLFYSSPSYQKGEERIIKRRKKVQNLLSMLKIYLAFTSPPSLTEVKEKHVYKVAGASFWTRHSSTLPCKSLWAEKESVSVLKVKEVNGQSESSSFSYVEACT